MQREISYEWSPELVRLGARRFIARYAGPWLVGFTIIMLVAILALAAGWEGHFWWVMIILPAIYAALWFRYYVRVVKICDEMPDRKVTVRIEPESITFQTSEHSSTMKWSRIKKLWRYPEVLLIFTYDQHTYSMLPAGPLGEEGRQFIEEKVREHGGQVS